VLGYGLYVPPTTVVRRDFDTGWRELALGAPDPRLRAHVKGYWGYVERTSGPTVRVALPSPSVGLLVGFGPPVRIGYPRAGAGPKACVTSFVAGLHDTYAVVESVGWQQGVQVDLTPTGAHVLVGAPMSTFANQVVELGEVLGRCAARLAEQLGETASWERRFGLIDALLATRLAAAREPSPAISWAWRRLSESGGRLSIAALAADLGSSRQYLVTRFREEIGLPPKMMARILRFQRAVRLLQRDREPCLAVIARECGYYDQAHLNRDFREFAGSTPTEYLTRRLPDGAGVLYS
jgi:AraC-like DNA-binding protein